MTQYYQDIITEESWLLLQDLRKKIDFILIGGWAVYLYTKNLKSKDIDIIVDYSCLKQLADYGDLTKNTRLKKYEIKKDHVDIDIYVPHFSHIGLPVETIMQFTEKVDTFTLLKKEIVTVSKLFAYSQRKHSTKGKKDKIDIISLMKDDFDFDYFKNFCNQNKLNSLIKMSKELFISTTSVDELTLNSHSFATIKKKILVEL